MTTAAAAMTRSATIVLVVLSVMGAVRGDAAFSDKLPLATGTSMPQFGLGTMNLRKEAGVAAMVEALNLGYRLLDSAIAYHNHEAVAEAVTQSKIPRSEIFITSKIPPPLSRNRMDSGIKMILDQLGSNIGYVDLVLIHDPEGSSAKSRLEAWRALEEIYEKGQAKAIGVSNFNKQQLEHIVQNAKVKPSNIQIYFNPYIYADPNSGVAELKKYCDDNNITVTAYGSIDGYNREAGKPFEVAQQIAQSKNKTVAQIGLRWAIQKGVAVIPKSSKKERQMENMNIYDFSLTEDEMKLIDSTVEVREAGSERGNDNDGPERGGDDDDDSFSRREDDEAGDDDDEGENESESENESENENESSGEGEDDVDDRGSAPPRRDEL